VDTVVFLGLDFEGLGGGAVVEDSEDVSSLGCGSKDISDLGGGSGLDCGDNSGSSFCEDWGLGLFSFLLEGRRFVFCSWGGLVFCPCGGLSFFF